MTDERGACREWEPALALYVESDLVDHEVGPLEGHLTKCAECRALLSDLRASQAALHSLASEPIQDAALDAVRRRVRVRLARRGSRAAIVWRWAVAATVVLAAGLVIVGLVSRRGGQSRETLAAAAPSPVAVVPPAQAVTPETVPATVPKPSAVRRAAVVRPRVSAPALADIATAEPAVPLTSEEADQLARAIVLLSHIERLDDFRPEAEKPRDTPPAATVRLTTADPNVVIYWSFESNGGES